MKLEMLRTLVQNIRLRFSEWRQRRRARREGAGLNVIAQINRWK